jgi:hypothetical protein
MPLDQQLEFHLCQHDILLKDCPECLWANYKRVRVRVAELEAGEKHYQTRLARIASMAGNPDPAQACRLIIQAATEPV